MGTEREVGALQLFWEHFFKAETGTYEKSTWLELFLAEFIIRLNDVSNPKELINFCPVSGVVSLVGCELLCGIHRVTSAINTHYTPPANSLAPSTPPAPAPAPATASTHDSSESQTLLAEINSVKSREDDRVGKSSLLSGPITPQWSEILRQYLLAGLAWRCLVLLKALGVEGLSCCRQLSSVLIWLFGELTAAGLGAASRSPAPCTRSPTPIHQLFSNRIWSKQKSGMTSFPTVSSARSPRSKLYGREACETKVVKKSSRHSTSDSGDSDNDLQVLNQSMTIKLCSANDDFDYFDTPVRSPIDYAKDNFYDPFNTPRRSKPKAEDYMKEKHREIISSKISPFEFTLIIIDLLQELCKAESSLSGSEGSQISMQCINFSLKNLCSLQFGSLPAQSAAYEPVEVSRIKVALTELLIISLDQVLVHADLCTKLINVGVLPMLLRILEDVVCKLSAKYNIKSDKQRSAKDDQESHTTESHNVVKFIFGIAYSITAFFHCLLMQSRTVDKLREFTDQFKLYGECSKGGLLKECIELMIRIPDVDNEETVLFVRKLIESIGKLISGMKRVRSEVIHSAACPRSRHKACRQRVAAGMHHHHDILGEAGTGLPLPSACCVSVLYGTLTSLLPDEEISAHKILRNKILHVMLKCGVCCCSSPSFLMESIVRLMLTHSSVAPMCLRLLEHTVFGDLGASVLVPRVTDQLPCSVCEQSDDNKNLGRKYCAHGVSPMERKNVWSFLIHYNSLLQLDNHTNVLHATVSHLLKVTPKCRMEMKYELLFSVVYPTFIVSKHRYIIRMEEAAYFLTVSCLNIFANLLNTVPFAEQFIQKGGLSYVLELISFPEFSNQCCAILEIAIIVEIFKLTKENAELAYCREISTLASIQMLFKSLSEVTEKCCEMYRTRISPEIFEKLYDINKETEILTSNQPWRSSAPIGIESQYIADIENKDLLELLKNLWTFWNTCASLCVHSPLFRELTASEAVFPSTYRLLKLQLHEACEATGAAETRLAVKIMEALLTVHFAVSEGTSSGSAAACCAVVRSVVGGRARCPRRWRSAAGGLRALCDALVGVANSVARPCVRHTIRSTPPKVASLSYGSSDSSVECSSSEESVCGPYASEHSDTLATRTDDGYEADVELSKLEANNMFKTRKLSDTSIFTHVSGEKCIEAISKECPEYNRNGELTHSELCVIVIDILTQLIDKLLEETSKDVVEKGVLSSSSEEIQRVCGSVARACAARLAPAASVAGRPPPRPRLLLRLLANNSPAARLLSINDDTHAELQRSILELVVKLGSESMEACELAALLRVCHAESAPLGALLGALARLGDARPRRQPHVSLDICLQRAEEVKYEEGATRQQAEATARRLQYQHIKAGVVSGWSACAARCAVEAAGWAPWLHGFSLHLTLALSPASDGKQEWIDSSPETTHAKQSQRDAGGGAGAGAGAAPGELAHVLSVGHDSLVFELWASPSNGDIVVKLTRPESDSNRSVCEGRVRGAVPPGPWAALALRLADTLLARHMHMQVTVYVNGRELETLSLPIQGILVRKATPFSVLVGDAGRASALAGDAGRGRVRVCGVRVYRAPVLTVPVALHLAAHPSDLPCQVPCDAANYASVVTPELLDTNIEWEQIYEISSATLREVNDNLLLAFSASSPDVINLYHPPTTLPAVFGSRAGPTGAGGGGGAPEPLPVTWHVRPRPAPRPHHTLHSALLALGTPELLLYLYARVVEVGGDEEQQATALRVLLRACAGDARLLAALVSRDTLDLLLPVFACADCRLTAPPIAVIVNEACDKPVIEVSGGVVRVDVSTSAVLLQPAYLLLLLRASKWLDREPEIEWLEVESFESESEEVSSRVRRSRGSTWGLALAALRALLRRHHPRRAFNAAHAAARAVLRHLLDACKERFLNCDSRPLSAECSDTLVQLTRALIGDPPLLCDLAQLADFLLLMHQASDTFITHSRANFYFLLSPDTPESTDFNILQLLGKRNKKQRSGPGRRDNVDRSSSSSVSNEEPVAADEGRDGDSDKPDHAADSKQMKSLINSQIKESRKSISSMSENSEPISDPVPVDREAVSDTAAADGADSDPLGEYEVIDEKEFNDTAEENYKDALYRQPGVRAGAEPGWSACEGLLLLLRDALLATPLDHVPQPIGTAIQPEQIIVLANHSSARVRAAVVRLVCALDQRRTHPHLYVHLANQICQYECSAEVAEACAALLTGRDGPLQDQTHEEVWSAASDEWCRRACPLLAVLPGCLADAVTSRTLAPHVLPVLGRLIDKCSVKALQEVAVCETLVRCVRAGGAEGGLVRGVLARLAVKVLAGNHPTQMLIDLHNMLTYIEHEAAGGGDQGDAGGAAEGEEGEGAEELVLQAARDAQVSMYVAQLDHLECRLRQLHVSTADKIAGYLTNVLSSVEGGRGGRGERAELRSRHASLVSRAVSFLLSRSPRRTVGTEEHLLFRLLDTLITGVCEERGRGRGRWGGSGEGTSLLWEVLWWAGCGARGVRRLQPRLLRALYREQCARPALLATIAPVDPRRCTKLSVYLLTMIRHIHLSAESGGAGGDGGVELAITDWAREWAVRSQAELSERAPPGDAEAERFLRADEPRWVEAHCTPRTPALLKSVFGRSALAARVAESAMSGTRRVVETQNGERKAFLEHLRDEQARHARALARWHALLDTHAHPRGVCHRARGWPASWQLDSTEGPGRARLRLRRAHLRLPRDKLQPAHMHKADNAKHPPALWHVVGGAGGRGARLAAGETVAGMWRTLHVSVAAETRGELLLTDRALHFVPDRPERSDQVEPGDHVWPAGTVYAAATRRWCLKERAIEVFSRPSRAHLLSFESPSERDSFLSQLVAMHPHIKTEPESLSDAMNSWRNGLITNWEYLMILNGLAGRSYNDLMQYPVLPFVIADYSSKILDLTDLTTFRDLSKPMAVQNKNREQQYINTYNDLAAARRTGCSPLLSRVPHHYASLYSNSGGVLHYLVRLPPFTEQFLNYQDNNFDMPDRTFHSLMTTWRLITQDSPTDVKELIPELFYMPELFYNNEGLELGVRQCGVRVDSVELPRWAADARLFTLAHRQALEAPQVTENLPHWIDLVFGYKQTGQQAIDAINVFPSCTYYGFEPSALEDDVDRNAAEAMVRTYGQAPRQLLRTPHPHAAPSLAPRLSAQHVGVYAGVSGVRWGAYCGSPQLPAPRVVLRRTYASAETLLPLPPPHARTVAVAAANVAPLALHDDSSTLGRSVNSSWEERTGLLSWGHGDGAVRLRTRRDQPPDVVYYPPPLEQITCVCTWRDSRWGCALGLSGGGVAVLRAVQPGGARVRVRVRQLHAHGAPVAHVAAAPAVTLLATASDDGVIVLWDLHDLTYIRTLPNRDMLRVRLLAASPTLSDVASVHDPPDARSAARDVRSDERDSQRDPQRDQPDERDNALDYEQDDTYKYKSLIRVHTVNGRFVGSVKVKETVTCVQYSGGAEGAHVNCVAAGLRSGAVRLYSSWELRPLAHLPPPHAQSSSTPRSSLTSLMYSWGNELLFACYKDGTVAAWESLEPGSKPAPVRIIPALALL